MRVSTLKQARKILTTLHEQDDKPTALPSDFDDSAFDGAKAMHVAVCKHEDNWLLHGSTYPLKSFFPDMGFEFQDTEFGRKWVAPYATLKLGDLTSLFDEWGWNYDIHHDTVDSSTAA